MGGAEGLEGDVTGLEESDELYSLRRGSGITVGRPLIDFVKELRQALQV